MGIDRDSRERQPDPPDGSTRRDFLSTAVAAGGAMSLGAFLPSCGGSSSSATTTTGALTGPPVRGGNFRLAVQGGGTSETLNPTAGTSTADYARAFSVYEPLVALGADGGLRNILAEEFSSTSDFTEWRIKLIPDVLWHDGTKLTVDDVIYCMSVTLEGRAFASFAATGYAGIIQSSLKRIDDLTMSLKLSAPNSLFVSQLSEPYNLIFQKGVSTFDHPIGTGPFKFVSWTRGERATYAAWDEYRLGRPYFDTVEILSISDPSARLNALMSNAVDAISDPSYSQIPEITSNAALQLVENPGGAGNIYILMACTPAKTFVTGNGGVTNNNLVRQALRYLAPREQILESVFAGHARIGNDLSSWFDPQYDHSLPQRPYDPEKAKSLLKQADVSSLESAEFVYADIYPEAADICTLFASACTQAGFPPRTKLVPAADYYASYWPNKFPISVDFWRSRALADHLRVSCLPGAVFNETSFNNPQFNAIYAELTKTGDASSQEALFHEAQRLLYDQGGNIVPAFGNYVVAASNKVINIPQGINNPFANWNFRTMSFKS
jgi:peptide/nickel transport system substrate-binding protein